MIPYRRIRWRTAKHGKRSHASLGKEGMRRFVAVLSFTGIAVIAGLFTPLLATAACPVDNPECHKLPPPPPPIPPSPPTPSPSATGVFRIDVYRSILDQAGEYILRKYRQEGKPGTLSWAGPPPTRCGHGCVDAPVMTVWGYAETYSFLNFHWDSADGALGRDRAGNVDVNAAVRRQAQNVAIANAGCQAVAIAAFGRGPAGGAITGAGSKRQARNAATTSAGCKALHTDNAFSGDRAGHAIACKQARNAAAPSARSKTADAISAAGADQAGHRVALAASGKRCQARNTATAHTRRNSSDAAACKANCAGCCCCEHRAGCGAQGCSTATQGLPARKGRGGRERSARL